MSRDLRANLQAALGDAYRIERELGGGGMSRVFLAHEVRLARDVVVKVLSPELAEGLSVDRFEREIRTVAGLQQANIVPVLTAGETDGLPFYTMPYVDGESLRAPLARGPLPIGQVVSVLKDVARALAYAHARGVVHRDIKPDNVLLSGGTAVVTDFGIAKAISAARTHAPDATLTQVGTSIGTPAYMAPEQAAGDPDVDHRADLYALGAMGYELLAGRGVFPDRTPQRMLAAHMAEAPRAIGELRPDCPAPLASLVMQCLAKSPAERPPSAAEVASRLDAVTSTGGLAAGSGTMLPAPAMLGRALAIYAVAFVAIAVLAKVAIAQLGLPDWVYPGALVCMALGLPAVLMTGYAKRVRRLAANATPTVTPGGTAVQPTQGTLATLALKASPHPSWRRTARGGAAVLGAFALAVALFMTSRATGIGPFASLLASGRLGEKDRLLLADFAVNGADAALGRVVSDAVRAGLSESRVLSVVSSGAAGAALVRMAKPADVRVDLPLARELAAREGIKAIVDGDITAVGAGYIVQLRLVQADSGTVLASLRATGDGPGGLIAAADQLARALREKAGESLKEIRSAPPLAEATTASLEALQRFTAGRRANGAGRYLEAARLMREAIALDSNFALAWRDLATNLSELGFSMAERDSAAARAYRLRDRLSPREREAVTADYYRYVRRDRAKAIEAYWRGLQLGDYTNTNDLGILLASRRELALAESLAKVRIAVEPERVLTYANLAVWQLAQGKVAAAETTKAMIERAGLAGPMGHRSVRLSAALAEMRGDFGTSITLYDSLGRTHPEAREHGTNFRRVANLLSQRGKLQEAASYARRAAAADLDRGAARGAAVPFSAFDTVDVILRRITLTGPSAALVTRLDSIARIPTLGRNPLSLLVSAYAQAGRPKEAQAALARLESVAQADSVVFRLSAPQRAYSRAEVAFAEGRFDDALRAFREADQLPDGPSTGCHGCVDANLARVFDAAQQADSALVHIESALRGYTIFAYSPPGHLRGLLLERAAQLLDAKGDAEGAARRYREFIALWQDADPELQPRVAQARRRVDALTAAERARR